MPPAGATWTIVEPYIAGPPTEGPCRIPYSAQVALVDPSVGTVLGLHDVPWFGRLVDWGDGFAVIYDGINQPDGVIAFDSQMEVAWQAEVTGRSFVALSARSAADGSLIVWGRSEPLTHLTIRVSLDSGRVEWEKRTDLFHAEPVPLGDVAVAWTYNNEVIGIDLETGDDRLDEAEGGPVGGDAHRVDGTLVVPRYRGSIVGVNHKGRFKFVWPVEGNVTGVVAVVEEVALVTTYVDDDVSRLRAIDLTDGAELWSETVDWQSQVAVTQSFAVVFEVRDRGLRRWIYVRAIVAGIIRWMRWTFKAPSRWRIGLCHDSAGT